MVNNLSSQNPYEKNINGRSLSTPIPSKKNNQKLAEVKVAQQKPTSSTSNLQAKDIKATKLQKDKATRVSFLPDTGHIKNQIEQLKEHKKKPDYSLTEFSNAIYLCSLELEKLKSAKHTSKEIQQQLEDFESEIQFLAEEIPTAQEIKFIFGDEFVKENLEESLKAIFNDPDAKSFISKGDKNFDQAIHTRAKISFRANEFLAFASFIKEIYNFWQERSQTLDLPFEIVSEIDAIYRSRISSDQEELKEPTDESVGTKQRYHVTMVPTKKPEAYLTDGFAGEGTYKVTYLATEIFKGKERQEFAVLFPKSLDIPLSATELAALESSSDDSLTSTGSDTFVQKSENFEMSNPDLSQTSFVKNQRTNENKETPDFSQTSFVKDQDLPSLKKIKTREDQFIAEAESSINLSRTVPHVWYSHRIIPIKGSPRLVQKAAGFIIKDANNKEVPCFDLNDLANAARARLLTPQQSIAFLNMIEMFITSVKGMHDQGLLHRDLKPHNVLCSKDGKEAGLTDFGTLSKIKSKNYELVGSPNFMAPEVTALKSDTAFQDRIPEKISEKSEIWSMGISLWAMLSGEPEFTHPAIREFQWGSAEQFFKSLATLCPSFSRTSAGFIKYYEGIYPENFEPGSMAEIVWLCTRPDPQDRPDDSYVLAAYHAWKEMAVKKIESGYKDFFKLFWLGPES